MAIQKAKNTNTVAKDKPFTPASDEAMMKLARVMTDAPTLVKLANAGWEVRALKPAVQWEIAKIACDIHQIENASYGDVITGLAKSLPNIVRIITLALLNDKQRIEEEYDAVYDMLMWESKPSEWANLLLEILNLHDIGFFLQITQVTEIFRQMTLQKRRMMEGQ
jgi:hypothetical protein